MMLSPSYLEHAPDALTLLWQQVEDDILRDVARRISKMETLTETANWQLWRYQQTEALRQDVVKKLARYTGKSEAAIRQLMQEAATRALEAEDAIYYHYDMEPTPFEDNAALQALLNAGYQQTAGTFRNLTGTTANTVSGQFEAALDRAQLKVSTGAFDYKSAVKSAVDSLADGMKYITYPTGHKDTLEVACRRAVLTGVNQTAAKLQVARADEMGVEFFSVTAHGGARPTHAVWQGKTYHRGGAVDYLGQHYEDFESSTGYGTGAGLCGWNCRHTFFAVFPELGPAPTWTQESLDALNARDIEYNGGKYTQYEISQMQRARERTVRKYKRRYLAETEAGVDATDSAVKLRAARAELADFAAKTGGRVDSARVSVAGFGRSASGKAAWAAKDYEKRQKDAIIIENLRSAAKLPKAAVIHLEPAKINTDTLTFDDTHINAEREHHVSESQAKQYIRDARISVSVWNGQFERYYGSEGAAYVNTIKHEIRTTYSRDEFDENTTALIEEMKKNGILR
jgi:hypothetical protein|nr:MAG TPA_asm: minor capsid protein [Caudoviricetes sp.]